MAAEPTPNRPDSPDRREDRPEDGFLSVAESDAYFAEHPEIVEAAEEAHRRYVAWKAAGNTGHPPGYVRARDYFRERFGLDV
jgi:hypothetical protein